MVSVFKHESVYDLMGYCVSLHGVEGCLNLKFPPSSTRTEVTVKDGKKNCGYYLSNREFLYKLN